MNRDVSTFQPPAFTRLNPFLNQDSSELDLYFTFFGTYRIITSTIEKHLSKFGLNEAKCTILMLLFQHPDGLTPSQLADDLHVTRGTVSSLVESLHYTGLVNRYQNRFDRRTVTIRLTEKGRDYIASFLSTFPKLRAEILEKLEEGKQLLMSKEMAKSTTPKKQHLVKKGKE